MRASVAVLVIAVLGVGSLARAEDRESLSLVQRVRDLETRLAELEADVAAPPGVVRSRHLLGERHRVALVVAGRALRSAAVQAMARRNREIVIGAEEMVLLTDVARWADAGEFAPAWPARTSESDVRWGDYLLGLLRGYAYVGGGQGALDQAGALMTVAGVLQTQDLSRIHAALLKHAQVRTSAGEGQQPK